MSEAMMGERYDEKADIVSFGIVLSDLDSHVLPYHQFQEADSERRIPNAALPQMVSFGMIRVEFSEHTRGEMVELGNAYVAVNPKDRPRASDVLYVLHYIIEDMGQVESTV